MDWLRRLFGALPPAPAQLDHFVYVRLPMDIDPEQRWELFEKPIDAELTIAGLGSVSGGGTCLNAPDDADRRSIEYCGVDVDTHDIAATRELLRRYLPILGCPKGTDIEFDIDGVQLRDIFDGADWSVSQPARAANGEH